MDCARPLLEQKKEGPLSAAYTRYRSARAKPIQLITLARHVRWLSMFFQDGMRIIHHALNMADFGLPSRGGTAPRHCRWRKPDLEYDGASSHASSSRFSLSTLGVGENEKEEDAVLNKQYQWIRPCERQTDRVHYFNAGEIRALYLACETLFERILMTSLFTTGMRIGGFCSLAYSNPITNEMRGVEKGNIVATYSVTKVLSTLLSEWIQQSNQNKAGQIMPRQYMFGGRDAGPDSHIAPSTVRRIFQKVACRAGVEGKHVHPHTTRHTVAWTLHALGNSVERVAGFVGHKSPQVTSQVYIALTEAQQRALVHSAFCRKKRT